MFSRGKWIVTLVMCLVAVIAMLLGILIWNNHDRMSGMFIGFALGIVCGVVAYHVSEWRAPKRKTEVPSPKQ